MKAASLSIKNKILILSGTLIILLLTLGSVVSVKLTNIGHEISAIADDHLPFTKAITDMTLSNLEQVIYFEAALRFGEEMYNNPNASIHFKDAIEQFEHYGLAADKSLTNALNMTNNFASEEATKVLNDIQANRHTFTNIPLRFPPFCNRMTRAIMAQAQITTLTRAVV